MTSRPPPVLPTVAQRSVRPPRLLAVASGGGHWVQLMRILPAFEEHEVVLVTVNQGDLDAHPEHRGHVVPDATRWNKFRLVQLALQLLWIVLRERPAFVVTTGAAPGFLALRLAKLCGSKTVWIDSIANVQELSLSGRKAGKFADLWLTQWEHLARPEGPRYMGAVL